MSAALIRILSKPTIELSTLAVPDTNYGSGTTGASKEKTTLNDQEENGKECPLLYINDTRVAPTELQKFELDCTGFIPKLFVKVSPTTQDMTSMKPPMDGDIMQVYVKSGSDVIKPIRCDFLITKVETTSAPGIELTGAKLAIEGKLNIPHLYDEVNLAIDDTSFNALKQIAEELGLGYASNVQDTDDQMKWCCAYKTREQFINEIVDASWNGKESFFTAFIDMYYNLNLVEVNSLYADCKPYNGESTDIFMNHDAEENNTEKTTVPKELTNSPSMQTSNYSISSYKPINKASDIARKCGYSYKMKMFDYSSMQPFEFNIEPTITEGSAGSKMLMKGKAHDDSYKDQVKTNFAGIQYTANVHDMYYYAKVHNFMNLMETEKMGMNVTLSMCNLNFIRYDNVPIIITIGAQDPQAAEAANKYEEEDPADSDNIIKQQPTVDYFHSGTYVLKGMKFVYTLSTKLIKEEMILSRREWDNQYDR